jgi:hypothetical protein
MGGDNSGIVYIRVILKEDAVTQVDRRRKVQKTVRNIVAMVTLVVVVAGCTSIGPGKLVSTHQGYNDAVQLAESRELLLNIVRLRFGDPIQFLAVSQINAQFSVSVGASASATGGAGTAGGNVGYSDSPTITFTPRGDDQFGRDILYPVSLYDAVTYSTRGGVYDGLLFTLITSGINDAPDVPGPNGELYRQRIEAVGKLLEGDLAWVAKSKRYVPKSSIAVPVENITAFDHVWATNNGYLWADAEAMIGPEGAGKALMSFEYHTPLIAIRDPDDPETQGYLRTLGVVPGHREYEIRAVNDEVHLGRPPTFIFVGFRSLKEIMGIASEYVEIPAELAARGIAPPPRYQQTGMQKLSFKVRSSKDEPQGTPYKVSLHDHWFFIDMTDHKSKALMEALFSLFYSQIGASKPGDPILTLPLSPSP